MSTPFPSDTEDDSQTIQSTPSTDRKKWKANVKVNRSNKSHTTFFFRIDENNSEVVYCKVCERNFSGTHQTPYPYSRKGGNTSNLIGHLRDRHNIIKSNYTEYLNEHQEV